MYRLFDAVIACEFPLASIPVSVTTKVPDIQLRLGTGTVDEAGYCWFHHWRDVEEEPVIACASRVDEGGKLQYLLRFPALADFEIYGDTVTCFPQPDCDQNSLQHLLLDQLVPRFWASRGNLVLHGSAVQLRDGRLIAFIGESGWGKSTLAGALGERGHRVLCDDSLCLRADDRGVQLIPSYAGLRLNGDSITELGLIEGDSDSVAHYSEKRRFQRAGIECEDSRSLLYLDTLYIMVEPGGSDVLHITPASGIELVATLIKRSFLLDIRDKRCAARQMQETSAVLRVLQNIRTLGYPRDYRQLTPLCEALEQELVG